MKLESIAQKLQTANKGFIVAPAGYGKTHLIAESVVNFGNERELILTHTHAGVDSVRRKVLSLNPSRKNFHIETIDGFILRYVVNYPHTSNWQATIDEIDWPSVRACGVDLFKEEFVKRILKNSYSGLYIDEYQDCCMEQHAIALEITSVLPTRILGDPLQGIFDFGSNKIVDWENDVESNFNKVGVLDKPWRWDNASNSKLGNWLKEVRNKILNGQYIGLNNLPDCVKHINTNQEAQIINACYTILSNIDSGDSVVIICKADRVARTHGIASKLKGCYGVIEPIESKDLKKFIDNLGKDCAYEKSIASLDFAICCFSGINKTLLKGEYKALSQKKKPQRRKPLSITQHLEQFLEWKDLQSLLSLLESFKNIDGSHLFRKELYWETLKIIKESIRTSEPLKNVMILVRENTRRLGRKLPKRIIGRTLLIKGLEFDHVIIVNADSFNKKNLYVALTRASKSVTIISGNSNLLGTG